MTECIIPRERLVSSNNIMRTQALFLEYKFIRTDKGINDSVYNLKDYDWNGTLSMQNIYVACASEYDAAMTLVGSWNHWLKLKRCNWLKPYLEAWEAQRKLREETDSKLQLLEAAEDGNVTAAKTIFDQGRTKRAGRPTTADKAKVARDDKDLDDFLKRSMSKVTPIK